MNDVVKRQFSMEALWGRVGRVVGVGGTWFGANGAPSNSQQWGLLVAALVAASYSHKSKGK